MAECLRIACKKTACYRADASILRQCAAYGAGKHGLAVPLHASTADGVNTAEINIPWGRAVRYLHLREKCMYCGVDPVDADAVAEQPKPRRHVERTSVGGLPAAEPHNVRLTRKHGESERPARFQSVVNLLCKMCLQRFHPLGATVCSLDTCPISS